MEIFMLCFEIVGTVAFALSGAMTGMRRGMDIFGICVLGMTTALAGGMIRDLILGITPPATFSDPKYLVIALSTSIIAFFPFVRRLFAKGRRTYETVMLISDSAGLGIFTVYGAKVAIEAGYGDNLFLVVFVAVLTGVGGGVLRDVFAGDRPYIFVKHVYASAALAGALVCVLTSRLISLDIGVIIGFAAVFAIRVCSAVFRWSLPKAKQFASAEPSGDDDGR